MRTKIKRTIEWTVFPILGILVLAAGTLLVYQLKYSDKIYKNVSAAGVDLSGKTKLQAAFLIDKNYNNILEKEIKISTEAKSVTTKVKDTGLELNTDKIVDNSYQIGRSSSFTVQLYQSAQTLWRKQSVEVAANIDQSKYNDFLKIAVAQLNSDPVNATLTIKNGAIEEVAEKDGQTVVTENLQEKILALLKASTVDTVTLDTTKKQADVKAVDFTKAKSDANAILNKQINLTYQDKTYTPSAADKGNWIKFTTVDGQLSAALDDGNIKAYLQKIAANFEVPEKDTKVNSLDNSVISQGQDGLLLNKDDALAQIKNQINSGTVSVALNTRTVTSKVVKVITVEGLVPGKFQGKYLDVDITKQQLCEVDTNDVVACYTISSGKASMPTPTGTFPIIEKNPRHWSSEYSMWLPWWERLTESGVGIHELPETDTWKETAEHLGTPVSHGCIRLGVGPAEAVYNWTDVGTIVYVHK